MLLLICQTNLLSGNHMNNYYQAMFLLWMFPLTETVSFMHASPNSRIVGLLRLNKQVIWGIIWWIISFFTQATHQYQATWIVWLGVIWPCIMHLKSKLNWDKNPFPDMLLFLLLRTMLITWDLPMWIDASMQMHRNYVWSLAVTPWILQFIRLTLAALGIMLWINNFMAIQTTLKMLSICCTVAFIINASSPTINVNLLSMTHWPTLILPMMNVMKWMFPLPWVCHTRMILRLVELRLRSCYP